jgi:hypothetical protein
MTEDELRAFVAAIRAQVDEALARLATIDPAELPPEVRQMYDEARRGWESLRQLTDDHVGGQRMTCTNG